MKPTRALIASTALFLVSLSLASPSASGKDQSVFRTGAINISGVWTRATPGKSKIGAAYLTLKNTGATPDRLVSVSSKAAKRAQIHTTSMDNGVMKMRNLKDGIALAPGATSVLKPGGKHIMLMGLKAPIVKGDAIAVTLTFARAGDVTVMAKAAGLGALAPDATAAKPKGAAPGRTEAPIKTAPTAQ